ncbi:hypothetical protein [Actinophytocola gossypii]|uniref:Uncharacterized protein n=1 Tax=Actinophytocola gossypii TaxID=2812003 RepID=A0ABT2J9R2_9PSEU|nr:hypothetical protein [Actinophytocola gossypii]MCT2584185.1 hypothetical protein [Actinophytocola gossypii]
MPDFYTDKQGRVRPIRGGGKGAVVVGAVVLGMIASGGGIASVGVGGGTAGGQVSVQTGVGSVRLGGSSAQLRVRKTEGQKSARRGEPGRAWQRMGLRQVKRTPRQQVSCVVASFGQVRTFLARHRCTFLERVLFAVADEAGNVAVVSVAWIGLRNSATARAFRELMDVHGSGDITPLGGPLLDLGEITFTGLRYGSDRDGTAVTVAEAENALGGQFDHDSLDAIAEVAAFLPRV